MRFADILKEAFIITWRNPWFWLAGFLLSPQLIGGYPVEFQYQPGDEFPIEKFLIVMAIALASGAFALLAGSIIQPAMILATSRARAGTPTSARDALRTGFEYAGRCLLLALLSMGCFLLMFTMLGVPIVIAFINSRILGIVVAIFFLPVMMVAGLLLYVTMSYSYRNIVLLNMGLGDSVSAGFQQFWPNKLASIGLAFTGILIPAAALSPLSFVATMARTMMQLAAWDSIPLNVAFYSLVTILSVPLVGFFGAFTCVLWTTSHQEWFCDGSTTPRAKF